MNDKAANHNRNMKDLQNIERDLARAPADMLLALLFDEMSPSDSRDLLKAQEKAEAALTLLRRINR